MRVIDELTIHCSFTPRDMDIGVAEIRDWHVNDNGWDDIGYHFVIRRDGTLEPGRPQHIAGAHVKGFNGTSIGVCMIGGKSETGHAIANYTFNQWRTIAQLITVYMARYPGILVRGHCDVPDANKDCPCFDVESFIESLGEIIEGGVMPCLH